MRIALFTVSNRLRAGGRFFAASPKLRPAPGTGSLETTGDPQIDGMLDLFFEDLS